MRCKAAGTEQNKSRQLVERFDAILAETQCKIHQLKANGPADGQVAQAIEPSQSGTRGPVATAGASQAAGREARPHITRHAALQRKLDVYRSDPKALAQLREAVQRQQEVWHCCHCSVACACSIGWVPAPTRPAGRRTVAPVAHAVRVRNLCAACTFCTTGQVHPCLSPCLATSSTTVASSSVAHARQAFLLCLVYFQSHALSMCRQRRQSHSPATRSTS